MNELAMIFENPAAMTNKQYLYKYGMVCYDLRSVITAISQSEEIGRNRKFSKLPLSQFVANHGIPKNALAEMGADTWNYDYNLSLDSDKLAEVVFMYHYSIPWKRKFPSVKRYWLEEFKYSNPYFWNIYVKRGIDLFPDLYSHAVDKLRKLARVNFKLA